MGIIDRVLHSDTHAINLLTADHREVDGLFAEYEKAEHANRKVALVNEILRALTVHAEVEEQIFYPATRAVLGKDDQDMVDERPHAVEATPDGRRLVARAARLVIAAIGQKLLAEKAGVFAVARRKRTLLATPMMCVAASAASSRASACSRFSPHTMSLAIIES